MAADHNDPGEGPSELTGLALTDDPDAPPSPEELRGAAELRQALAETEVPRAALPRRTGLHHPEASWLAAQLRLPLPDDALGQVRARGLARAARELLQSKRRPPVVVERQPRQSMWLTVRGTGGLLAAAGLLLFISWTLLEQALKLQHAERPQARASATALMLRASLKRGDSAAQRLDVMLQARLLGLRAAQATETSGSLSAPQVQVQLPQQQDPVAPGRTLLAQQSLIQVLEERR